MATSTLTSKGQVTIPKSIRERLGLEQGDVLEFRLDDHGGITLRPAARPSYLRLSGLLHRWAGERPVSVEEMKQAVRRRAAEKYGPKR